MKYVESITVCPSNKVIQINKCYQGATATVCPSDADKTSVCWYSEDENIAAVNPTMGYIYGISLGTTSIYARACDGSGVKGYMTVTVAQTVPVESITLDRSHLSIEKDTNVSLTASIYPEDATNKSLTWCSSNESVARVVNGVVCGIGKGTATITATTNNGKSANCIVTVTENILVTSITVYPSTKTMTVGDSDVLNATVCPTNATKKSVCWRSDNTNVVTVNEITGFVMAQNPGTATVYAIACDGSGVVGCCCIIVKEKVLVTSITVSPKTKKINVNASTTLTATISPCDATDTRIRWSCDQSCVVSVDSITGKITGVCPGTATVKAMACDGSGVFGSCIVTVVTVPVTGVSISPTTYTMEAGDSVRFAVTVSPSNATNKAVTWRSSDTSIATVTSGGCVIAKYPGNTTITVTTKDGGKTASCNLTVKVVDTRETVTIEKDDEGGYEFFKVTFKNGLVWKSVGYDLSDMDAWIPQEAKNRSNQNLPKTFSEDQIAFLYLFDPLGITHYVKYYYLNHDYDLYKMMKFKDRIYKKIFGKFPRLIKILPDKQIRYYNYWETISDEARYSYYSDAEVLFGEHTIVDFISIMSFVLEVVPAVVTSIFGVKYDVLGNILSAIDLCKFVFFSGAVEDIVSSGSTGTFEAYMEGITNKKALNRLKWANVALSGIETALNAAQVFVPSTDDIRVYDKVDLSNFQTRFSVNNLEISLQEIIENYN